jgi:ligand-binding SRPBCC domain-containing protein
MKVTTSLIINKPVVMVWNFFDNPDNLGKWLTDFKRFEPVSGMQGHIGSKSRHFYNQKGKELILEEEITARQKYHHLAGKLSNTSMTALVDTVFTDLHDGRTQMDITNDMSFLTFPYKLMTPFISGSIRKRQQGDYEKLKKAIEATED